MNAHHVHVEESNGTKIAMWRTATFWLAAFGVGSVLGWLSWLTLFSLETRSNQIAVLKDLNEHERRLNTGTDDRFRGSDWRREKEFLEYRFRSVEDRVYYVEEWIRRHDSRFNDGGQPSRIQRNR